MAIEAPNIPFATEMSFPIPSRYSKSQGGGTYRARRPESLGAVAVEHNCLAYRPAWWETRRLLYAAVASFRARSIISCGTPLSAQMPRPRSIHCGITSTGTSMNSTPSSFISATDFAV